MPSLECIGIKIYSLKYLILPHCCYTLLFLLFKVAVLDIDICGPSQPRVLGVLDEQVHQSGSGWSPVVSMT